MALCYIKATPTTKFYDRLIQNKTGRLEWEGGRVRRGWGRGGGTERGISE